MPQRGHPAVVEILREQQIIGTDATDVRRRPISPLAGPALGRPSIGPMGIDRPRDRRIVGS